MVLYTVVSVYAIEVVCYGLEIAKAKLWRAWERESSPSGNHGLNVIDIDIQDQLLLKVSLSGGW